VNRNRKEETQKTRPKPFPAAHRPALPSLAAQARGPLLSSTRTSPRPDSPARTHGCFRRPRVPASAAVLPGPHASATPACQRPRSARPFSLTARTHSTGSSPSPRRAHATEAAIPARDLAGFLLERARPRSRAPLPFKPTENPPAPSNPSRHPTPLCSAAPCSAAPHAGAATATTPCRATAPAKPHQRIRPEPRVHSELACSDSSHDRAGIGPDRRR
jgi:hypothetical protein